MSSVFDAEVEQLLREIAVEEGLTNAKIEKLESWVKGENYLGQVTPVRISEGRKSIEVMVKTAAKSDKLRENAPINLVYEREICAYNTLLPLMRTFELDHGVKNPIAGRTKCYKASFVQKQETLIMENLKKSGFSLANRRDDFDHDYMQLIFENYARFHAVSFAIRDQEPQIWKKICSLVTPDIYQEFEAKGNNFSEVMEKSVHAIADTIKKHDENLYNFFEKYKNGVKQYLENTKTYENKRFTVFLHGDSWTNNMLFKYEDPQFPKKPTDMRMVDFQVIRVGSPVVDLSYTMYSCASKDVYNHLDDYLKIYHNAFCDYLKILGTDPQKAISFTELKEEWKNIAQFGVYMSIMLIKVRLTETSEAVDLAEEAEKGKNLMDSFNYPIGRMDEYNKRFMDVIEHCKNYGV